LEDVAARFAGAAAEAGVVLKVTPNATSPRLLVDPERLEGVLSNLTANALRHTPVAGHVTLSATAAPGGAVLAVADTGEGIAAADLPFVFDRFWRGDRARGRTAGAGLGLAIARQLVLAHGGTIEVSSAPGAGTTFSIFLPME
jgi:two-component system sensor histidine kinase BaeS